MAAELVLYNDIQNRRLVQGLTRDAAVQVRDLYQGEQLSIKWYPVVPTGTVTGDRFSKVALATLSLAMYIGPRAGADAIKAYQTTWTPVYDETGTTGYFSGSIDLNTTEMNAAIGTADEITSLYLEIKLTESGATRVVHQSQLRIVSVVKDPSTSASLPTAAQNYLTREECMAMFVQWANTTPAVYGKPVVLTSPNGIHTLTLWVDNDGIVHNDVT